MSGGMMKTDISGKADTVLTTKGDLATWNTARVRKGVSVTNYTGLQADSAIADGLTYGATARSTLTGIGDLCASSAANTLTRIAASTSGHVLTSNGVGVLPTYQAAGGGLWEAIADYEATSAEASHTFTFTGVDFDDDSMLVLVLDGSITLGTFALQMTINGVGGGNYHGGGRRIQGGVETLLTFYSTDFFPIADTALFNSVNENFFGIIQIGLHKSGSQDRPLIISEVVGGSQTGDDKIFGNVSDPTGDIDEIVISTPATTWQIGTRMTLYKVARA